MSAHSNDPGGKPLTQLCLDSAGEAVVEKLLLLDDVVDLPLLGVAEKVVPAHDGPFDVQVEVAETGQEIKLSLAEARALTFGEALDRLGGRLSAASKTIVIDVSPESRGAALDDSPAFAAPAPRIVVARSAQEHVRLCRELVPAIHGPVELPWMARGVEVDGDLWVSRTDVPDSVVSEAYFRIDPQGMREAGRRARREAPGTRLVAQVHSHPSWSRPRPSMVDRENFDDLTRFYHPLNRRPGREARDVEADAGPEAAARDDDVRFRLDDGWTAVIPAGRLADPTVPLHLERTWEQSRHAFVITNEDGDPDRVYAEVIEIRDDPGGQVSRQTWRNCGYEVVPDEDVASATGLPIGSIRRPLDREAVAEEIRSRVQRLRYAPATADVVPTWPAPSAWRPAPQVAELVRDLLAVNATGRDVAQLAHDAAVAIAREVGVRSFGPVRFLVGEAGGQRLARAFEEIAGWLERHRCVAC